MKMEDGIIKLDSPRGKKLGWISQRFDGWLWKKGQDIYISFIVSKRRGNFRQLVKRLHKLGFTVKIPTPLGRMQELVIKNGYKLIKEKDPNLGVVDVWKYQP